jgi:hypothetical protein
LSRLVEEAEEAGAGESVFDRAGDGSRAAGLAAAVVAAE